MKESIASLPTELRSLLDQLTELAGRIETEVLLHFERFGAVPPPEANRGPEIHGNSEISPNFQIAESAVSVSRGDPLSDTVCIQSAESQENISHGGSNVVPAARESATATDIVSQAENDTDAMVPGFERAAPSEARVTHEGTLVEADSQGGATESAGLVDPAAVSSGLTAHFHNDLRVEDLLPLWMEDASLLAQKKSLFNDLDKGGSTHNSAGLLIATLILYTFAAKDADPRALQDSVRDLGRRLLSWIRDRGYEDSLAAEMAHDWAILINKECLSRCEIEVPTPGAPAMNHTMNFRPRAGVTAQTVSGVNAWCVRGGKREVVHRAEVTV